MTRQHARLIDRRSRGVCAKCPTGTLDLNPKTGTFYGFCPACREKKNARQRIGPARLRR